MYDYQWLVDLMTEFGQSYPEYFDATLGADLRTVALLFWVLVLYAVTHPEKGRNL